MDMRYLHRLSRQYRPRSDDEPTRPQTRSGHDSAQSPPPSETPVSPPAASAEDAPATHPVAGLLHARRRTPAACELCGRTLLTGESATPVELDGIVAYACPLCVIGVQTAARGRVA